MTDDKTEAARNALLDVIIERAAGPLNPTATETLARAVALVVNATPAQKESGYVF